jgi:hypothetical protein
MSRGEQLIVNGMPEEEYHAHPALSSTQARQLLDSPARYHYAKSHPQAHKASFDLGTAVHSRVLGTGAQLIGIPLELLATNGAASTKAAKEFIEQARADGLIPVKADVADEVRGMSEAVLAHPTARALFEQEGQAEASVFATDPETGVETRARFDFLPRLDTDNPIAVDLKTTGKSASPAGFIRSVLDFQYDVQEEHYEDTLRFAEGIEIPFVFVVVETAAPHLVGVHQLDIMFREMGQVKARRARQLHATCSASGEWPGYPTEVSLLAPPVYAIYQHEEKYPA